MSRFDAAGYRAGVLLSIAATVASIRGLRRQCSLRGGNCADQTRPTGRPLCVRCALIGARVMYTNAGITDVPARLSRALTIATEVAEADGLHTDPPAEAAQARSRLGRLARHTYERFLPDDILVVTIPLLLVRED